MDHATQVELAKQILDHIAAKTTAVADAPTFNPVDVYTSGERLKREQEILFRRYPLLLGLSCRIPEPGDYFTDDYTGVPILVVRGEGGEVSAFFNICRHRGARVAEDCGSADARFVCPYHAWTYDLDGRLVGMPYGGNFDGVEPATHGLRPLPAAEKDGLIWVMPSADGVIDPDRHLGALAAEIANYGFASYHHYETRTIRAKINWKVAVDTFLEPYHFGSLHKATVGPIFVPNLCLFHPYGFNLRETFPRRTIEELSGEPETAWNLVKHTAIVYLLFPNTVFVMQADHVEIWRIFPADNQVDACVMDLDFYIPEPVTSDRARGHWDRNMDLAVRTVVEEDFATGEGMQFGFASGALDHVVYGRNEPALAHFEKSVTAALE